MAGKKGDKRVARTKQQLQEAFAALIEEKGLEAVTVSELTKRADVNRGTFYAHYADKNDFVEKCEREILEGIFEIQATVAPSTLESFLHAYETGEPLPVTVALYALLAEHGAFVRALIGPQGDPRFSSQLKDALSYNTANKILKDKYQGSDSALVQYYLAYYTDAQHGVMKRWLSLGMKESPEEMARILTAVMFMLPGGEISMPYREEVD